MGAEYLSYVRFIATEWPTFFGYIISVLASVYGFLLQVTLGEPGGVLLVLGSFLGSTEGNSARRSEYSVHGR